MIEDQIKIAEEILAYVKANRGYTSKDDLPGYLQQKLYLESDIWLVKKIMEDQDLIQETDRGYFLRLTTEGSKAAKMGYSAYCSYLEKKEIDKDALDHRAAVMSKWQIIAFWPMFIFGVIGGISGIISLGWQLIKWLR